MVTADGHRSAFEVVVFIKGELQARRHSQRRYGVVRQADLVHVIVANAQTDRCAGEGAVGEQSHSSFSHGPGKRLYEGSGHHTLRDDSLLCVEQLNQAAVHAMLAAISAVVIHNSSDIKILAQVYHPKVIGWLAPVKDGGVRANRVSAVNCNRRVGGATVAR